jgi:hypothetical protein
VFFDSLDALVPEDVNNNFDVYEFEPEGAGTCAAGAPGFSSKPGGCVSLLSSGTAPGESVFFDASESGGDVYFLTAERLLPEDKDTALDLYDAHSCTTASPCPATAVAEPPCTTADACRPAATPQPASFGPPPSSTFSGPGNLTPPLLSKPKQAARKLTRCKKGFVKNKKHRCVKKQKSTKGSK